MPRQTSAGAGPTPAIFSAPALHFQFFAGNQLVNTVEYRGIPWNTVEYRAPCHFLHRMAGVKPATSLHSMEKNGVVDAIL